MQFLEKIKDCFTSCKILQGLVITTPDPDPELDPDQDTIKSGNFSRRSISATTFALSCGKDIICFVDSPSYIFLLLSDSGPSQAFFEDQLKLKYYKVSWWKFKIIPEIFGISN